MPEDNREIDNIFYNDGYKLAENILKDFISAGGLLRLTQSLYENIDELLSIFETRVNQENKKIDCKKSCHWCCTQAVFINPREALYIADYLKSNFDDLALSDNQSNISKKYKNTKSLSLKEQLTYKEDCPFLIEKNCSIYPARPMACRIYLSMSLPSCKANYDNPESEKIFAKLYDFPLHAGRMLNQGSSTFIRKKNIEMPALSLEAGMEYILNNGNAIELWLRKEKGFPIPDFSEEEWDNLDKFQMNNQVD